MTMFLPDQSEEPINFISVSKIDKESIEEWTKHGFVIEEDCSMYCFSCDIYANYVMTKPATHFTELDAKSIVGKELKDVNECFGTYGMGGCGYMGFKHHKSDGDYWIVVGVVGGETKLKMDGRVFSCHDRKKVKEKNPWYYGFAHHPENSKMPFFNKLCMMTIEDVSYVDTNFFMNLKDSEDNTHFIEISTEHQNMIYHIKDKTDLMV